MKFPTSNWGRPREGRWPRGYLGPESGLKGTHVPSEARAGPTTSLKRSLASSRLAGADAHRCQPAVSTGSRRISCLSEGCPHVSRPPAGRVRGKQPEMPDGVPDIHSGNGGAVPPRPFQKAGGSLPLGALCVLRSNSILWECVLSFHF